MKQLGDNMNIKQNTKVGSSSDFSNRFTDTKWYIKSLIKNKSLNNKEKRQGIKDALHKFNTHKKDGSLDLSLKGRVYLYLYRHNSVKSVFLLETLQAKNIRKYLPTKLINLFIYYTSRTAKYKHLAKHQKKIVVALVPDHGNLGDLAIGFAQRKFLDDNFREYEIIEIPIGETYKSLRNLKKKMTENDIIMVNGGGNMGNLYREEESQRRFIIRKFPNNNIISFPQSVFFSNDKDGKSAKDLTQKIYNSHKSLTLFARDQVSFDIMNRLFKNQVFLLPDTVLYLQATSRVKRISDRITLSLRRDIESNVDSSQKQKLVNFLEDNKKEIIYKDTNVDNIKVDIAKRKTYLDEVWSIYSSSEAVITDRLHGVIFCVITKTPCIAINNNNGKVANLCRTWLKDLKYIRLVESFDSSIIMKELEYLSIVSNYEYSFNHYFEEMKHIIKR